MIDTLTVKNFRCFEELELRKLARINIIVGENASGKTALLESLFFGGAGNPEVALRLRGLRGAESLQITRTRLSYESLWKELFFDLDQTRKLSAKIKGSPGNNYEVSMFYGADENLKIPLTNGEGKVQESPSVRLITFAGKSSDGKPFEIRPDITPAGITPVSTGEQAHLAFFSSTLRPSSVETAQRFSDLRKEFKHQTLVKAITSEFSFIRDLDIETESGVAAIYATIEGRSRKLRLGLVSGGLDKLVSVLLGIQAQATGTVLIDEIGNDLHYTKLPALWSLVRQFSDNYKTQVFASTHSWECLKAAESTIEKHTTKFSLIRTEFENGKNTVKQFSGERILSALKQNMELR